jgi:glycosyltransferase involved in cell wall biosynthesis
MKQEWMGMQGVPGGQGRILFVAPAAYPLGGVAVWLSYIVPGLRERGWDVIAGLTSGGVHDPAAYTARHPMSGVVRINCNSGSMEARIRSLTQAFRRYQPDIVTSVNIPDVYIAIRRLRQERACKIRAVMALHALDAEYFHDIEGNLKTLDAVIAVNRLARALADQRSGLDQDRGFYAPCGVPPAPARPAGRNDGVLRIAVAGRLTFDQKRIEDIPPIAAGLEQRGIPCEWLIAGAGPQEDWLRRELRAGVENGTVHFFGSLNEDELSRKVYQQADALLITSSWETGPIVAWEAMAHGAAVVSSRYTGLKAEGSLRHLENCLLFPAGDTGEAIECLAALRDAELHRRLTEAGRALVERRYSREASIDAWSRSFAAILARPPLPPVPGSTTPQAGGRLDRLLGVRLGENVRELCRRRPPMHEGGEVWPHSHSSALADNAAFLALAAKADETIPA